MANEKIRSGWYGGKENLNVPPHIERLLHEANPDWDWTQSGEYIVLRMFDEGVEVSRVVSKFIVERDVSAPA